jgi:hypothetical protein
MVLMDAWACSLSLRQSYMWHGGTYAIRVSKSSRNDGTVPPTRKVVDFTAVGAKPSQQAKQFRGATGRRGAVCASHDGNPKGCRESSGSFAELVLARSNH